MAEERKIKLSQLGTLTKEVIWLGVPLKVRGKVIGCMALVCYYDSNIMTLNTILKKKFK
jgi:hypothetical protein